MLFFSLTRSILEDNFNKDTTRKYDFNLNQRPALVFYDMREL